MVLAHGSGVDDVLMFVIPVVIALVVLRIAERRAGRRQVHQDGGGDRPDGDSAP